MNLSFENQARKKGARVVVGLDEAGRGPLAGPVTAAAVCLAPNFNISPALKGVYDSKELSLKERKKIFKVLSCHPDVFWGLSWTTPRVIDRVNILEATKKAMERAVSKVESKTGEADLLFIDGSFEIGVERRQKPVKKGDQRVFSCAAASIIAKVKRDEAMLRYHRQFPRYRFDKHKGYPTELHRERIETYGPCPIHRKSFRLVK